MLLTRVINERGFRVDWAGTRNSVTAKVRYDRYAFIRSASSRPWYAALYDASTPRIKKQFTASFSVGVPSNAST